LRTREAVVDALMALLEEGRVQPSVEEIAVRAHVSERSIFGHFHDREGLFGAVRERQTALLSAEWGELPPPSAPLAERLDAFVAHRARIYELIAPVRRAGLLMEPFSDTVRAGLAGMRAFKRDEALRLFGPELGDDGSRRAALAALASYSAWEEMRVQQALSVDGAAEALRSGLTALLA
jgi:AcrR family transcriptional regulator